MIEIIKQGKIKPTTKYKHECAFCDCVFSYQYEDIYNKFSGHNEYYGSINCPSCEKEFVANLT